MSSSGFSSFFYKDGANGGSGTSGGGSPANNTSSSGIGGGGGSQGIASGESRTTRRTVNGLMSSHSPASQSGAHRRPSLSTTLTHHSNHHSPASGTPPLSANAYTPTQQYVRDPNAPYKYSKDHLLGMFLTMQNTGNLDDKLDGAAKVKSLLLVDGLMDKEGANAGWGGQPANTGGSEVCWERPGGLKPVGLEEMTAEEKELFSSVNSPLKTHPPNQNPPGGANSTGGGGGGGSGANAQQGQPRQSNSQSNLNNSYNHKSNTSTSSAGAGNLPGGGSGVGGGGAAAASMSAATATASSNTRGGRARRESADQGGSGGGSGFQPLLSRRRTELRNTNEDAQNAFERFTQARSNSIAATTTTTSTNDDNRQDEEDQPTAQSATRPFFKRSASTGWGAAPSPVTPGGSSALAAFSNGAFGGVGGGFMLNSGVPVVNKGDPENKKGSFGRSSGRKFMANTRPLNEEEEDNSKNDGVAADYQQLDREFDQIQQQQQQMMREEEAFNNQQQQQQQQQQQRPNLDNDPFNRRESVPEGGKLEDHSRTPVKAGKSSVQDMFGDSPQGRALARNVMTTPTRNLSANVYGDLASGGSGTLGSPLGGSAGGGGSGQTPGSGLPPLQTQGMSGGGSNGSEPLSPADTNPYQSPVPEKEDDAGSDEADNRQGGTHGLPTQPPPDMNQLSGAPGGSLLGPSLSGLQGLGGLSSGLGSAGGSIGGVWGTPAGSASLLGNPGSLSGIGPGGLFGPGILDIGVPGTPGGTTQPPTLGLLSSGSSTTTSLGAGRGSRLGALFPAEQQQQLQQQQQAQQQQAQQLQQHRSLLDDESFDPNEAFRELNLGGVRNDRGDDVFGMGGAQGGARGLEQHPFSDGGLPMGMPQPHHQIKQQTSLGHLHHSGSLPSLQQHQGGGQQLPQPSQLGPQPQQPQQPGLPLPPQSATVPPPGHAPPPRSHAHIMVMPDKIQWTYRDPAGNTQGPFSGLEMHDWYRAGFFTPELQVKRVEDTEFEPLGQLIRRIGNSREPFLVPMQGPAPPPGTGWPSHGGAWGPTTAPSDNNGTLQPPFAGSFPSFGTTLTADQQNALERRKQEEQYLMARQREYLVQQQVIAKQVAAAQHMSRLSQESLHHQHSNPSLHSQPSLGSLQSPGGFPGLPPQPSGFGEPTSVLRHVASGGSLDSFSGSIGGMPSREDLRTSQHGFPAPLAGQPPLPGAFPPNPNNPQQQQQQQSQIPLHQLTREQAQQMLAQNRQAHLGRQQPGVAPQSFQPLAARFQMLQGHSHQPGQPGLPFQVAADGDSTNNEQATSDTEASPEQAADVATDARVQPPGEEDIAAAIDQHLQLQLQQQQQAQAQQTYDDEQLQKLQQQQHQSQFTQEEEQPVQELLDQEQQLAQQQPPQQQQPQQQTPTLRKKQKQRQQLQQQALQQAQQLQDQQLQQQHEQQGEDLISSAAAAASYEADDENKFETSNNDTTTTLQPAPEPTKNPWGTIPQVVSPLPQPFPPPPPQQSSRPENINTTGDRMKTRSPDAVETPLTSTSVSVAPWAKDPESATTTKGPSLKEIQAIEARQAAIAEAAAAEAKREQMAAQLAAAAQATSLQPAPGLPSSATWGSAGNVVSPTAGAGAGTPSAWAKPLAKAPTTPAGGTKKTLAQIQKEEELRKAKSIAQAAVNASVAGQAQQAGAATGTRQWASKAAAAPPPGVAAMPGGAWTTVGAGGKKVGGGIGAPLASPTATRPPAPASLVAKPKAASSAPSQQKTANDELIKWCKANLKGLDSSVNVDDFVAMILTFPLDVDIVSDSVYASSTTLDGRRFAEEFIRRRKLANQGVITEAGPLSAGLPLGGGNHHDSGSGKSAGGWNEVAKKKAESSATSQQGQQQQAAEPSMFKVVAKKKGRR